MKISGSRRDHILNDFYTLAKQPGDIAVTFNNKGSTLEPTGQV